MLCLIVDDDEMVRIDLENRITAMPGLVMAASCGTATEAAGILMNQKIDLVFLDVQLPDMNAMQLMRILDNKRPDIILITSKKEYAAEAFDYEVTDFLVKPFTDERLLKAVLRASRQRQSNPATAQPDYIFVRVNSVLEKIRLAEINYVEAMADYVQIQCNTKRYVVHSTMRSLEQSLGDALFFRVHNSYIVRLDKISKIEDNAVIIGEKVIPISRAKVKTLMEKLNLLKGQ